LRQKSCGLSKYPCSEQHEILKKHVHNIHLLNTDHRGIFVVS